MECQEAVLQLAALADAGHAPQDELASHLEACPGCRQVHQRLAELDARLESWADAFEPSADFDARLMARIEGEIQSVRRAHQFREQERFDAEGVSASVRRHAWQASVRIVLEALGWGAVAAVLLFATFGQLAAHTALPSSATLLTALAAVIAVGALGLVTDSGNRLLRRWLGHLLA